jgi:signal transduction histidine kinase
VGEWLVLRVADTGIGIAEEQLRQIFHPFTQGDAAIKRMQGGTGLGLAICHRYTQLMGGDIAVESVEGNGTTCTVRLPLEQPVLSAGPEQPVDLRGSVATTAAITE